MSDNPEAPKVDNPEAPPVEAAPAAPVAEPMVPSVTWKSNLNTDLKNSPLVAKFDDSAEGLNKALESHANLESLLGHEKVPIPKGPEDAEGWNRFSKAMGIPDKAEGYGLADFKQPEGWPEGAGLSKDKFAEIVHAHKLTPGQAKGLWNAYQEESINSYKTAVNNLNEQLTNTVNELKGSWGDTYETNIELGQAVINKFSADQDSNDFITNQLAKDPRGAKFLASIGEQFAENKVPEFQLKRFSLAPEEAQNEIDRMTQDLDGPYMNTKGKFTEKEHETAIARVNHLRQLIVKAKGQAV